MAPRKTTKKSTRGSRSVSKKTISNKRSSTTKKKAAKPRITKTAAKNFGAYLQERYE